MFVSSVHADDVIEISDALCIFSDRSTAKRRMFLYAECRGKRASLIAITTSEGLRSE